MGLNPNFVALLRNACAMLFGLVIAPVDANSSPAPQRIVSLAPHATELLFSAGLGSRVVGVSEACDFPEAVKTLPKVSSYRGTNVEAVLALKPDLVVTWPSGNKADDVAALERLGLRVYKSEIDSLEGIAKTQREFAGWAKDEGAIERAGRIEREVNALREKFASRPVVRVFYQLGDGRLFTLSNKHLIGEALATCGAKNIFGALSIPAPEVSREAVIAARPDAILLASESARAAVTSQWRTTALASTPIVIVNGGRLHRPTLRTIDAARELCESIERVRTKQAP
ncbi:MAG: cobalamin-binding protein [Burkholderiales bacterium]|nr:MAG: cobalamin-binding protein [Burkholderiales bacterium]TAG82250.1 MAG: cobalamin-binding protein [Betaproteobacteria bacterium]